MWVEALSLLAIAAISPLSAGPPEPPTSNYPSEEALRRYAQGRLLEERNEGSEALGEYYRALLLDSRSIATDRRLSEVSARLGDASASLEFAERALAIDPTDARALWLKGAALFNLRKAGEALTALEAAVSGDSTRIEYARTLARVGEELDRFDVLARACRRVVELDDQDGEAWFQLAAAEARLGRFEAARAALDEAAALAPGRPGIQFLEGWVEEALGRPLRAINLYQQHLKIHTTDDDTRSRLVRLLMDAGRNPEAYREAQALRRSRPDDLDALDLEAELAFRLGHPAEGAKLLDRIARFGPDDPGNLDRRLDVLTRATRAREAVELAEAWSAQHPGDYRGVMCVARARAVAGEDDPATAAARRAVDMAPDSLAPRMLLGHIHERQKRWAEAAEVWTGVLLRFPDRPEIALELARCREELGDSAGAEQAARQALEARPDDATTLNFLGYLLADHGRSLKEAERLIRRAVAQEPDNAAFVDSMGWVYYRLGWLEDARRELERALRLGGGNPVMHEHLGDVYKDMRLIELARQQYRLSLALDRENHRVKSKLDGLP